MPWGDPGVTELLQLSETSIDVPALSGGSVTRTLQRAGLLRRLRFYYHAAMTLSANTGTPTRSVYGPLAGINSIAVSANGQIPLVKLSGFGATVYNEVANRDASVIAPKTYTSALQIASAADLWAFEDASGTSTYNAKFPFEFQFSLPVSLRGMVSELGLWLLQNQSIDVGIDVTFNPVYQAAATKNAPWSGGTVTAALTAGSQLEIERELYNIPNDPKDFPNLAWAHQVIEYTNTFTGNFARFSLPRSGLLLRAIVVNLDSNGAPVEYTDLSSLAWIYGANETPVTRKGAWLTQEYLQDYGNLPPKGVHVLDFYKWGWEGLKLVKDTEILANLRLESTFASTATGTQKIILERLYPVLTAQ